MERLNSVRTLSISQIKEWGEILTGFEGKNKYSLADSNGTELFFAAEEKGSLIWRLLLKSYRPFTLDLLSPDGEIELKFKRPLRFYFHELEIINRDGRVLGSVKREFSILRRNYTIYNAGGNPVYQLFGPILKPWTFQIMKNEREVGKITKKWSGLLKETFTDSDNFGVEFPVAADSEHKSLLLGSVFLIDFVHFENSD